MSSPPLPRPNPPAEGVGQRSATIRVPLLREGAEGVGPEDREARRRSKRDSRPDEQLPPGLRTAERGGTRRLTQRMTSSSGPRSSI